MTDDNTIAAPEGFKRVDLDWSSVPSIDWSHTPQIRGFVVGGRYAQYERRGAWIVTGIIKVRTESGDKLLWESYQLVDFMANLKPGDEILVAHTGKERLPNGNSMNTFEAYVKPGENRANRAPALGLRPEVRMPQAQGTLHGFEKPKQAMDISPEFDDDIPF